MDEGRSWEPAQPCPPSRSQGTSGWDSLSCGVLPPTPGTPLACLTQQAPPCGLWVAGRLMHTPLLVSSGLELSGTTCVSEMSCFVTAASTFFFFFFNSALSLAHEQLLFSPQFGPCGPCLSLVPSLPTHQTVAIQLSRFCLKPFGSSRSELQGKVQPRPGLTTSSPHARLLLPGSWACAPHSAPPECLEATPGPCGCHCFVTTHCCVFLTPVWASVSYIPTQTVPR